MLDKVQSFINRLMAPAISAYNSANILPSILIGQGALESDYGTSSLAQEGNNLFGVTGTGPAGSIYSPSSGLYFKKYYNWDQSINDYVSLLSQNPRYSGVIGATNYQDAAQNLQAAGYAGDSTTYASSLIGVIKSQGLDSLDNISGVNTTEPNPAPDTIQSTSTNNGGSSANMFGISKNDIVTGLKSTGFAVLGGVIILLALFMLFAPGPNIAGEILKGGKE